MSKNKKAEKSHGMKHGDNHSPKNNNAKHDEHSSHGKNHHKTVASGDSHDNEMHAGNGIDVMKGGKGNDTYVWEAHDGDVIIKEKKHGGASDSLVLDGIDASDVNFAKQGNHLVITIVSTGETITIKNQFAANGQFDHGVESVTFANGVSIGEADFANAVDHGVMSIIAPPVEAPNVITGTEFADTLTGTDGVDHVFGLAGDDWIEAGAGNDVINAGAGLDTVFGGEGSDVFQMSGGNGYDYVIDFNGLEDHIEVSNSLVLDGHSVMDYAYQDGASTIFEFGGGNVLVLWHVDLANLSEDMFTVVDDTQGIAPVNIVGAAEGETIVGGSDDNVIYGGGGYDVITGGHGADTFVFNALSDQDFIIDFNPMHDLVSIDASLVEAGHTLMDYVYQDGPTTVFEFAAGQSLVLWHVGIEQLSDSNFLIA